MAVGDSALPSPLSYLALGRETTFKTYNTASAQLPFLSSSIKTIQENKILEEVQTNRTFAERISMMKKIEGEIEFYAYPESTALVYILQNAFGGTISSATATGETAGGLAFTHTIDIGNFDQANSSLCINNRKGDSASGFVFEYSGIRVNELTFTGELEEPLKCNMAMMVVDSTQTSNDVASALTTTAFNPLSFVNGRLSVETTFASLTSTSFWHIQSVELGLNNSLKADAASGRIGSAILDVLPPGVATFTFNATLRFDTLTAYNAMLNETQFSAEMEFQGPTVGTSVIRTGVNIEMPRVFISEAGDPEIGGPDEVLTSSVTFHVLRDKTSTTGYAMRALVTNAVASY